MLTHENGLLDLGLLDVSLLPHLYDSLLVLRGDHLIVLHLLHLLLNLLMISLFKFHDFASSLARFLNLLACFQLFLLEQSDTIS